MFWHFIGWLARALLSLRYSVTIRGLDQLKNTKLPRAGGILFLPNHTALMDPTLLFLNLWPTFRMRGLVVEYIFREPLLRPLMRLTKALPVPDFDSAVNSFKIHRAEKSMRAIANALRHQENVLFYPSGRLKSSAKEVLGGASGAHALLQECPEANVVLIRTSGLWGSTFSRAFEGRTPKLNRVLWEGIKAVFKSGLFFMPRRKIVIELELEPKTLPRNGSRIELNRALEQWYNQFVGPDGKRHAEEPLTLIPRTPWEKVTPLAIKKTEESASHAPIPEAVRTAVYAELRRAANRGDAPIDDAMSLASDLGMDSLNIADLIAHLSRKYDVDHLKPEELQTVRDVLEIAAGIKKPANNETKSSLSWPKEGARPEPVLPMGRTLAEAFLRSCDRLKGESAIADDTSGVLSYKRLKTAALVLAQHFRRQEGRYIGVLLPASVGACVTILALELAGKTPVMLNWTLGPRALEDMVRTAGVSQVVTSWRFVDRLAHVDFGHVAERLVFLEDIRQSLTLGMKLRGAWLSLFSAKVILDALHLCELDEQSPAVVLFTSGTEANPKGVPLSHKNILANLRSGLQCINLESRDIMYGVLPPFHSFGFTVAGLVAIFVGMRLALFPDPTDSAAMAKGIHRWGATIFCAAPSFLKGLFEAAKSGELDSVRMFVSGAERTPPELYDAVKKLGTNAILCEGYGITECSPILTLNRPNMPPKGVGIPLPDVELITIHPETLERLSPGTEGEICVHGPNVFHGYLGNPRAPFLELHGKRWYRTGDLGFLDPGRHLILSGRLKRFIKVGGEMISLGAVEEAILGRVGGKGQIALCADEKTEGRPELVLFTTCPLDVGVANEWLKEAGFSRLVKIASVIQIEEIPLMGTGKTDYRKLTASIKA